MSDHRSREEKKEIVARNTLLANEMDKYPQLPEDRSSESSSSNNAEGRR